MTTLNRLQTLLDEQFGYSPSEETTLKELDADSLDLAELEMSIEVEFDVEVSLNVEMTVADVVKAIESANESP